MTETVFAAAFATQTRPPPIEIRSGSGPAAHEPLHAQVVLAELVDLPVLDDRRPDQAAAGGEVPDPAMQRDAVDDLVLDRVDLHHEAVVGPRDPQESIREDQGPHRARLSGGGDLVKNPLISRVDADDAGPTGQPDRSVAVRDSTSASRAHREPVDDLSRSRVNPDHLRAVVLRDPDRAAAYREPGRGPRQLHSTHDLVRLPIDANQPLLPEERDPGRAPGERELGSDVREGDPFPQAHMPHDAPRMRIDQAEGVGPERKRFQRGDRIHVSAPGRNYPADRCACRDQQRDRR